IEAVRQIDAHHLDRIRAIHAQFEREFQPGQHPLVAQLRDRFRHEVDASALLCIAGGHVAILLNRLRIAGLLEVWDPNKPIVAWGAGSMVLAERVVVFHDSPPQGHGNAEVFEAGFGLVRGIVPLPHARTRLELDVPHRVEMFARRFAPDACLTLETGSRLDYLDGEWQGVSELDRLGVDGRLVEVSA
ncbi:MAG: hypothetical protein KDB80_04060, partial [Planctomycetes bacterium]|nr:hypothetical protein [Planctomycetota bacterium]